MISAHRCSEVSCLTCSVELYWNVCFSCICGWDPQTPTSPAKHFLWVMVIHWPTLSPLWVFFTSHLASRNSLQLKKEVAPTFRTSFTLAWRGPASELCMWLLVQPLCCTVHLFPPHTHTHTEYQVSQSSLRTVCRVQSNTAARSFFNEGNLNVWATSSEQWGWWEKNSFQVRLFTYWYWENAEHLRAAFLALCCSFLPRELVEWQKWLGENNWLLSEWYNHTSLSW